MNMLFSRSIKSLLATVLLQFLLAQTAVAAPESVSLQLFWKHQFEFAGYYAAKEKGFYRDANLDVDIREYASGINTLDEVVSGRADFATVASSSALSYLEGKPVTLLANIFKHSALVLLSARDAGIRIPADLSGKRIMLTAQERNAVELVSFFSKSGIDRNSLHFIDHNFDALSLVNGQTDVMSAYITNQPFTLQQQGIAYNILDPATYGIDIYGDSLIASTPLTQKRPELVEAFKQASLKGWAYALENPEEIIDLILANYNTSGKSREALQFEAAETAKLIRPESYPLGSIDLERLRRITSAHQENRNIEDEVDLGQFIFGSVNTTQIELTDKELNWLNAHPQIEVAINNSWPPFDYVDDAGNPQGIGVDLLALLNQRLDGILKIVPGEWKQIYDDVKERRLDALLDLTPTEKREPFFNFTTPYLTVPHVIVASKSSPFLRFEEDLDGKTVALEKGFGNVTYFKKNYPTVTIREYPDTSYALDAVARGEADAYAGNRAVATHLINKEVILNLKVHGRLKKEGSVLAIGVRKDWPELRDILEKALDAVTDEERSKLLDRWVNSEDESEATVELSAEERTWLKEHEVLRIGVDDGWAPFEFRDEKGNYSGISAGFTKELEGLLAVELVPSQKLSWTQILDGMRNRDLDIIPMAVPTAERLEYMNFTRSYISFPAVVVTRRDADYVGGLNELSGQRVGVVKNYITHTGLIEDYPEIEAAPLGSVVEVLQQVMEGNVDAGLVNLAAATYEIQRQALDNQLKIASPTEYNFDLAMGVRKDWP